MSKLVNTAHKIEPKILHTGYVIINQYHAIWHDGLFPSKQDAQEFLENFWKNSPDQVKKFIIVLGKQVLEAVPETDVTVYIFRDENNA